MASSIESSKRPEGEEPPFHKTRMLGPYGPDNDARQDALDINEIRTTAWAQWLREHGISRAVIEATLDHDDLAYQEAKLREAFTRTSNGRAAYYIGAYSEQNDLVGFAKFLLRHKEKSLHIHLAELNVLPEFQGVRAQDPADHHLAKKMIYSMLAHVRDPQAVLTLFVLEINARARHLYESIGLEVVEPPGMYPFVDDRNVPVRYERYLRMEGAAMEARDILRDQVGPGASA